jgi:hypothetical protein
MNVVSIQRKQRKIFLSDYSSSGKKGLVKELTFLAGAALTLLLPTLVFCIAIGQFLPFYFIALNQAAGIALGIVLSKKSPKYFLSCIPNAPPRARIVKPKKAA